MAKQIRKAGIAISYPSNWSTDQIRHMTEATKYFHVKITSSSSDPAQGLIKYLKEEGCNTQVHGWLGSVDAAASYANKSKEAILAQGRGLVEKAKSTGHDELYLNMEAGFYRGDERPKKPDGKSAGYYLDPIVPELIDYVFNTKGAGLVDYARSLGVRLKYLGFSSLRLHYIDPPGENGLVSRCEGMISSIFRESIAMSYGTTSSVANRMDPAMGISVTGLFVGAQVISSTTGLLTGSREAHKAVADKGFGDVYIYTNYPKYLLTGYQNHDSLIEQIRYFGSRGFDLLGHKSSPVALPNEPSVAQALGTPAREKSAQIVAESLGTIPQGISSDASLTLPPLLQEPSSRPITPSGSAVGGLRLPYWGAAAVSFLFGPAAAGVYMVASLAQHIASELTSEEKAWYAKDLSSLGLVIWPSMPADEALSTGLAIYSATSGVGGFPSALPGRKGAGTKLLGLLRARDNGDAGQSVSEYNFRLRVATSVSREISASVPGIEGGRKDDQQV